MVNSIFLIAVPVPGRFFLVNPTRDHVQTRTLPGYNTNGLWNASSAFRAGSLFELVHNLTFDHPLLSSYSAAISTQDLKKKNGQGLRPWPFYRVDNKKTTG